MSKKMKRNVIIGAIALLLVVVIIIVVVKLPTGGSDDSQNTSTSIDYGIDMSAKVSEDGMHEVTINTNEKGEIENNSYGTLIKYVPAQITKIEMKTQEGNYTFLLETPVDANGNTQETIYTLEGFEDFNVAATQPGLLASAICNVQFTKVADLSGEKASSYGFDNPRAEATVYYTDGTHSVLRLGDDAPGGEYAYVQFGESKTVYIVLKEDVKSMLFNFTELFDNSINSDKTDISDESFDKIILGGTHLEKEVVLTKNIENVLSSYYLLESHGNMPASNTEASAVMGSIKSITTESVVCVNPTDEQLKEYGLKTPYATVKTNYLSSSGGYDSQGNVISSGEVVLSVSLLASEADSEGKVYMMEENGKLIYKINALSVPWATTTLDKLYSEYVFYPNYSAIKTMEITVNSKTYTFALSTEEVKHTAEDGTSTTVTEPRVTMGGKSINHDQFWILFQDIVFMEKGGQDNTSAKTGEIIKIKYNYVGDRKSDTVVVYGTDTQKCIATVNSQNLGYTYKKYVTALASNVELLAKGTEISAVES